MSATNRGSERQADDFYSTPFWCVNRFLEAWPLHAYAKCYDPCVGSGAIVKAVNAYQPVGSWTGGDIVNRVPNDGQLLQTWLEEDFLKKTPPKFHEYASVIMTNPPFSLAEEFIKHSLKFAHDVIVLLRVNFLGSKSRRSWLLSTQPNVYVLPDRPIFARSKKTGKLSSDATEYAWFHFNARGKLSGQWTILNETSKEDRDRAKQDIIDAENRSAKPYVPLDPEQVPF